MIAVRLMGGLGNQMFQYAAARRLSLSRKTKLVLDISHYENQPENEVPRQFELDCFSIKGRRSLEQLDAVGVKRYIRKNIIFNVVKEKGLSFDDSILNAPDNTLLIGHWASESYFSDIAPQLRKEFKFVEPLSKAKQAVAAIIAQETNPVSVQVRRGDFVSHAGSSNFHGTLPLTYYKKAVERLTKTVEKPHFFVISDDPEWCQKNLSLGYPTTYVAHVPGTGHEDMRLTSICRHHIIANSTFSWWGAWLNPDPDKIVISPRLWFKDKASNKNDILPEQWLKI